MLDHTDSENNQDHENREDYEVGYKKPPKHSQWKKGESGNPRGRPKKTKEITKIFDQILDRMVSITDRGERKQITTREAIVMQLAAKAASGDYRFLKMALGFMTSNPMSNSAAGRS